MSKTPIWITAQPLAELQQTVAKCIEISKKENQGQLHTWLSVAEYLKDARRWHYARNITLPELAGTELDRYVDERIEI